MCGRFTMLTWNEVEAVVEALEFSTPLVLDADLPARRSDAFPRSSVPVVVADDANRLQPALLVWGYLVPGRPDPVFNARIETAAATPLWRESLAQRRCIVPARAFFEPHRTETALSPRTGKAVRQLYRFSPRDNAMLLMAGIWQDERFSILTTAPDESVALVHDRMPLTLAPRDARTWLFGDSAGMADRLSPPLRAEPLLPPAPQHRQLNLF